MARSASDATRFTSTGPHAATKPAGGATNFSANPAMSSSATQINFGSSPAPSGETPQQKIARLRAAAALAKQGKESSFDKTVRIGRVWADRAHRVTAITLIGFTVVSAIVATAGITDMMLHNRRRRKEWFAEKQAESARAFAVAKQAEAAGVATEDQMLLINRAVVTMQAEAAKKNRPGIFKRAGTWLGLSEEETKGGRLSQAAASTTEFVSDSIQDGAATVAEEGRGVLHAVEQKMEENRRHTEHLQQTNLVGGPLDRQAQVAVDTLSDKTSSWTGWISRK
ncbi:uncharacterized protein RCC_01663 [Ramularia collo-cygni]|uniref:Uncharacterized protein n=1 Tax=Ramularia collo-cygni TaxID=112498 RepID=A0A2D3UUW1_9PEZI|nr:uncharacterized protein RCC_01663 [Ramularia collo-cygni]CZT15827.1 uncharacterized protein RCC_01663 [Ramularia collo-cygni]